MTSSITLHPYSIVPNHPLILKCIRENSKTIPDNYRQAFPSITRDEVIAIRCNNFSKRRIVDSSIFTALRNAVNAYEVTDDNLNFMHEKNTGYLTLKQENVYKNPQFFHIAQEHVNFPDIINRVSPGGDTKKKLFEYTLGYEEMMKDEIMGYISFLVEKVNSVMVSKPKIMSDPETVADVDHIIEQERKARNALDNRVYESTSAA